MQAKWLSLSIDLSTFTMFLELPCRGTQFYCLRKELGYIGLQIIHHYKIVDDICIEKSQSKYKSHGLIEVFDLELTLRKMFNIIHDNISYRSTKPHVVYAIEALMVYWIKNNIRFNVGFIIASIMQHAVTYINNFLPYEMLLTKLFHYLSFDIGHSYISTFFPISKYVLNI